MMQLTKIASIGVAALALATATAVATAAPAAKRPVTGTWAGKTSQDLVDSDVEWTQRITVTALNGRLMSVITNIRAQCPVEGGVLGAKDIRILEGWRSGKGPRLTAHGGFTIRVRGVSITGVLGAGGASGRFDTSVGQCFGKGSWKARRYF
jgi:hypothetical protein